MDIISKCKCVCVCVLQVQGDAHVSQLFDRQQRGDDVLPEPIVYQHLHTNTEVKGQHRGAVSAGLSIKTHKVSTKYSETFSNELLNNHFVCVPVCVCSCVCVTFHTGSAAVFFRGGALKFNIRFRATAGTNTSKQVNLL